MSFLNSLVLEAGGKDILVQGGGEGRSGERHNLFGTPQRAFPAMSRILVYGRRPRYALHLCGPFRG